MHTFQNLPVRTNLKKGTLCVPYDAVGNLPKKVVHQ